MDKLPKGHREAGLDDIARFTLDENDNLYFDGKKVQYESVPSQNTPLPSAETGKILKGVKSLKDMFSNIAKGTDLGNLTGSCSTESQITDICDQLAQNQMRLEQEIKKLQSPSTKPKQP